MSSVSYTFIMIALIIPIIIGLTYILANKEKGNLVEYQKSSNYEFAKLSHGLTAYKQFGSKDNTDESILGLGEKQFLDTLKCFFISILQLEITDNLPNSFVFFLAIIL